MLIYSNISHRITSLLLSVIVINDIMVFKYSPLFLLLFCLKYIEKKHLRVV